MSEVVEACYGRGSALLEAKEYASACEELSGALDLDPTHGLALRDRGRCRQMLKQYGRALQDYDAALAVSPSADLFAERANVRYLSGDNSGAAADCDESITMSPNSAAYHTRARLRAESGEKSDAAEDYAAATHLEDEAREAFVGGTVSILDQLAEMRVALTSAVEALEQDDPDVDAHAESMEEYAQASRGLGTVPLKAVASVVGELSQRLITLYTIEDWLKTLEAADELILLDPNNALGHKVRCMTRITLGDIEGALQDADELVRVAPGDEYSYTTRAYLRARTGRERQALEDYRLLLELDPESVSVRNSLADLLATATDDSVRDGARAVMYAEQVLSEADEVSHHHLDTLAAAFAEVGQFDDAIREQEECLRLMPDGEDQSQFLNRLELYRQGRPYRSSPG